jgi:hypothetical protein
MPAALAVNKYSIHGLKFYFFKFAFGKFSHTAHGSRLLAPGPKSCRESDSFLYI